MSTTDIDYQPGTWFQAATVDDMQRFFLSRLSAIREAGEALGYAIGLHGSCRRDLDLIAAPWRGGAADADTLAHAIAEAACGITRNGPYDWESKPAGRVATSIPICWPGWYGQAGAGHIDLSVAPDLSAMQTRIDLLQSWEADASAEVGRLAAHLRAVLEIAHTWQPDYATKMDRDTLALAAAECGFTPA